MAATVPIGPPTPREACDLSNATTVFAQGHGSSGGAGSTLRVFQLLHGQGLALWLHGAGRCVRWLVHPLGPCSARRGALWKAAAVPDLAAELLPRPGSTGKTHRQEPGRDGGWAEGSTGEVMGRKSPASEDGAESAVWAPDRDRGHGVLPASPLVSTQQRSDLLGRLQAGWLCSQASPDCRAAG